jgi:hypothetical protein
VRVTLTALEFLKVHESVKPTKRQFYTSTYINSLSDHREQRAAAAVGGLQVNEKSTPTVNKKT